MNVLIGIPSHRGEISSTTAATLVELTKALGGRRMAYSFVCAAHAEVSVARNVLAARFLQGDFDTFIGIDDDVGVSREVIDLFLSSGLNFVGTYLPQRVLSLEAFEAAILEGLRGREAQLRAAALVGPLIAAKDVGRPGIREVEWIGTGFFLLRRSVLKAMIDKGIAILQPAEQPGFSGTRYGFFDNISTPTQYLSEDISFCRRVREAGYAVNAYLGPGISHTGAATYHS